MRMATRLLPWLACLLLCACSSTPPRPEIAATYYLVRHAEKAPNAGNDPPLTAAGTARAEHLSATLAQVPLRAIYSTATTRTRQTAAPTAHLHRLAITDYDASDAAAFAAYLRHTHSHDAVLVIGHSNTLPALARMLCQCAVEEMDEAVYGIRYTVTYDGKNQPHLQVSRD